MKNFNNTTDALVYNNFVHGLRRIFTNVHTNNITINTGAKLFYSLIQRLKITDITRDVKLLNKSGVRLSRRLCERDYMKLANYYNDIIPELNHIAIISSTARYDEGSGGSHISIRKTFKVSDLFLYKEERERLINMIPYSFMLFYKKGDETTIYVSPTEYTIK